MKDELGGRQMKECVGIRENSLLVLIDDSGEIKKNKGTKKCVIKTNLRH